jgi:protoporphyrinogen oxidase
VGIYRDGRIWPFGTARDVLRFGPIPPLDRLRLGIGSQRLVRARHMDRLDDLPAVEWLSRACGRAATEAVWAPLLRAKFGPAYDRVPAAWMLGRFRQRAGARRGARSLKTVTGGSGEVLGYMRGGFHRLFVALERRLRDVGVDVRTGTPVERIEHDGERVTAIRSAAGEQAVDAAVFAGTLPLLGRMMDTDLADGHEGLGAVVVVLELERSAQPVYWLNVCDEAVPFGGVIEHTRLTGAERYGGRHVVYLGRYFLQSEPVATQPLEEIVPEWLAALESVAPGFAGQDPLAVHPFRTPYAAPLVDLGYARRIAPLIPGRPRGLAVATTAQIYPADRGMDNGVRLAEQAVRELLAAQR